MKEKNSLIGIFAYGIKEMERYGEDIKMRYIEKFSKAIYNIDSAATAFERAMNVNLDFDFDTAIENITKIKLLDMMGHQEAMQTMMTIQTAMILLPIRLEME